MADETTVELRGPCPREIVDVIDAWSHAKRITRTEAVNHILRAWALEKMHEHMVLARGTKGNPLLVEAGASSSERSALGNGRAGNESGFGGLS